MGRYPYVTVFITKNNKIRARIQEEGAPSYEVTVGGENWKNGRGVQHKERIARKLAMIMQMIKESAAEHLNATLL